MFWCSYDELGADPMLDSFRTDLIKNTARQLDSARMLRYDQSTGYLFPTDLGRTASHFYVKFRTIEIVNSGMQQVCLAHLARRAISHALYTVQ